MFARDLGWLEGIIDGEGSLGLTRVTAPNYRLGYYYQPLLSIWSSDWCIVDRAHSLVGAGSVGGPYKQNGLGHRPMYTFRVYSRGLRVILPRLRLTAKEPQRTLLLEALKLLEQSGRGRHNDLSHYSRLDEIHARFKILNSSKGKKCI